MRFLFWNFPGNVIKCFRGYNLLWHFIAIVLTSISVSSGLDWLYFEVFRESVILPVLFPAVRLGSRIPIIAPLIFYFAGVLNKDDKIMRTGHALGQSVLIALLVAATYKAFTGRAHPPRLLGPAAVDISREFHFGFLRGGIFWGWPSSHTTIAFAMAVSLLMMYPENKIVRYAALLYAFYIGFGVSVTIHWFSDFMAGAIFGTIIGIVVGNSFRKYHEDSAIIFE